VRGGDSIKILAVWVEFALLLTIGARQRSYHGFMRLADAAVVGCSNARVYTAQISPGEQTLFHRHKHNTVYVTVSPNSSSRHQGKNG